MSIRIIKNPGEMTCAELAIEVERLRRGLQDSDMSWCPVCEGWYNEGMYISCEDHDIEVFGVSPTIRKQHDIDVLGYRAVTPNP